MDRDENFLKAPSVIMPETEGARKTMGQSAAAVGPIILADLQHCAISRPAAADESGFYRFVLGRRAGDADGAVGFSATYMGGQAAIRGSRSTR
jgi:hypothetical protein